MYDALQLDVCGKEQAVEKLGECRRVNLDSCREIARSVYLPERVRSKDCKKRLVSYHRHEEKETACPELDPIDEEVGRHCRGWRRCC